MKKNKSLNLIQEFQKLLNLLTGVQSVDRNVTALTLESGDLSNVDPVTLEEVSNLQKQIDELHEVILLNQRQFGVPRIWVRDEET